MFGRIREKTSGRPERDKSQGSWHEAQFRPAARSAASTARGRRCGCACPEGRAELVECRPEGGPEARRGSSSDRPAGTKRRGSQSAVLVVDSMSGLSLDSRGASDQVPLFGRLGWSGLLVGGELDDTETPRRRRARPDVPAPEGPPSGPSRARRSGATEPHAVALWRSARAGPVAYCGSSRFTITYRATPTIRSSTAMIM